MSDGDMLLRAILESPDEDTPRLAYADWLQENGQSERAKLIRVQIRLTHLRRSPDLGQHLGEAERLVRTQSGLVRKLTIPGLGISLPLKVATSWNNLGRSGDAAILHRGFVSEVRLSWEVFSRHAAAVFSAHPVRVVTLSDREPIAWINGGYCFLAESAMAGYEGRTTGWARHAGNERAILPDDLHSHLPGKGISNCHPGNRERDRLAATAAPSAACVAFGRSLAGLPPLPVAAQAA